MNKTMNLFSIIIFLTSIIITIWHNTSSGNFMENFEKDSKIINQMPEFIATEAGKEKKVMSVLGNDAVKNTIIYSQSLAQNINITDTKRNIMNTEWPHPNISHALFAKAIDNREPQGVITTVDNRLRKIYFFTNIRNLIGKVIIHRWRYKGRIMAEVKLPIGAEHWRTWSSKNLWHTWLGIWTVEVVDSQGNILLTRAFHYYKPNNY